MTIAEALRRTLWHLPPVDNGVFTRHDIRAKVDGIEVGIGYTITEEERAYAAENPVTAGWNRRREIAETQIVRKMMELLGVAE